MEKRIVYHGSQQIVKQPEIRSTKYSKDFATGFYCTLLKEQAVRWATRYPVTGYVNEFFYAENTSLKIKTFPEMTEEWLDFIADCRNGGEHDFDIVEGLSESEVFDYKRAMLLSFYCLENNKQHFMIGCNSDEFSKNVGTGGKYVR